MAEGEEDLARRRSIHFWRSTTKTFDISGVSNDAPEESGEKLAELDLHRTITRDAGGQERKVPASYGSIDFVLDKDNDQPARFATVSSDSDVVDVYRVLTEAWGLKRPSVILSVTGAAQSLELGAAVKSMFRQGLASAAQSTRSWIISGGSDVGVMALTGSVMDMGGLTAPCIGIPAYHKVMYKEKLATQLVDTPEKGEGRTVKYWKRDNNSVGEAALDANHTHFIVVQNDVNKDWAGEVDLRADLEEHIARGVPPPSHPRRLAPSPPPPSPPILHHQAGPEVPLVCICVGGGPGTFKTLLQQLQQRNPVLIVRNSGGIADGTVNFIDAYKDKVEEGFEQTQHVSDDELKELVDELLADGKITENQANRLMSHASGGDNGMAARVLANAVTEHNLIHLYSIDDGPFDKAILDVIVKSYRMAIAREKEKERKVAGKEKQSGPMVPTSHPPHVEARHAHPKYPRRFAVPDKNVLPWDEAWPEYAPPWHEDQVLAKHVRGAPTGGGWADPAKMPIDEIRKRYGGNIMEDPATGRPLNPRGRTGLIGRGLLGNWGPNLAADPIVTRWNPEVEERELQVVVVQRRDTKEWALPGGMVGFGAKVTDALIQKFKEEAASGHHTQEAQARCDALIDQLFSQGKEVYKGYVDEPRNTDNAWLETTAYHFHCSDEMARNLSLKGDSTGEHASTQPRWIRVDAQLEDKYAALYASHRDWVDEVKTWMEGHKNALTQPVLPPSPSGAPVTPYPRRQALSREQINWKEPMENYDPPDFTQPEILENAKGPDPAIIVTNSAAADRRAGDGLHPDEGGSGTERSITQKALEERQTYEAPISFDDSGRPRNPHGRTGLQGRGALFSWGPNHAVDTIVTRYHPRHDSLQFVALPKNATEWALPGNIGLKDVAPKALQILEAEWRQHPDAVVQGHIKEMVDEMFSGADKQMVYKGYVDDPRNTDNAWLETTAYHFHCSRELGGMLKLDGTTEGALGARWVTMDESDKLFRSMFATHREMVETVLEREHKHRQDGLLKTVVGWGKTELVESIITDRDLVDQRSPQLVQQAFQLALKLAGDSKNFEVQLINHLLTHGANPANVYISDLFRPEGGQADAFRYLQSLKPKGHKRQLLRRAMKKSMSANAILSSMGGAASQERRDSRAVLSPRGDADGSPSLSRQSSNEGKPLGRKQSRMQMEKARTRELERKQREEEAKAETAKRYAEAAKDEDKRTTPWQPGHVSLMSNLVPGYNDYAKAHTHATAFDLVLWAIMVGAFDLAEVLWKHKSCGSPLRAALIGQNMCKKIELSKKVRVKELQKLARTLSKHSLGMLDFLQDQEEARKLLLSRDGPLGTVGMAGSRRGSLMDLAIDFNNSDFVSHRYSQEILNEQWMGRSPQCGRIRLSDMVGVTRLVLQILAMPSSFKFVSTDVNDLFPHWGDDEVTVTVSVFSTVHHFFHIPLVKRATSMLGNACYVILQICIFFRPMCTEVDIAVHLSAVWVLAIVLEEGHQLLVDPHLYWQSTLNILDVIRAVLGIFVVCLRYIMGTPAWRPAPVTGATDAMEAYSDTVGDATWRPLQGTWMVRDDPVTTLAEDHFCVWSWQLELLRTFAALLVLVSSFRLFEVLTDNPKTGVLMVCIWEMLYDLRDWAKPTAMLTIAFGLVMHILAPEYRLDGSPGAFRPIPDLDWDFSPGGPFFMTFWALLGFYEPGELAVAPGTALIAPTMFWVYLLISLVLLINLLIAMFSKSYGAVMERSDENWKMSRVVQVKTYIQAHPYPPPLNLITLPLECLFGLANHLRGCLCRRRLRSSSKVDDEPTASQGAGKGGPAPPGPPGLQRQHTKAILAKMEESERKAKHDPYAKSTFPYSKAEAVEDRARQSYLMHMKTEEEKETEVTRKLKQLEEHMEDNAKKLDAKMAELQKILREELQKHFQGTFRGSSRGGGEGERRTQTATMGQPMQHMQPKLESLPGTGRMPFAVASRVMQQAALPPRPLPPVPMARVPQGEFDGKAAPPPQPQRPAPVAPPPAPPAGGIKKQVSFQRSGA